MKIRLGSSYNVYWVLPTIAITQERMYHRNGFAYFIISIGWWKWSIDIVLKDEDYDD